MVLPAGSQRTVMVRAKSARYTGSCSHPRYDFIHLSLSEPRISYNHRQDLPSPGHVLIPTFSQERRYEKTSPPHDIYFLAAFIYKLSPCTNNTLPIFLFQVRIPDLSNFRPFPTAPFPVVSLTLTSYTHSITTSVL